MAVAASRISDDRALKAAEDDPWIFHTPRTTSDLKFRNGGQPLDGTCAPMPVRRKVIPKPGGVRLLGIPTVLDRVIQQAVAQMLNGIWDPVFSEHSFGFRSGRAQHDAIRQYRDYVKSGLRFVVDIDLSKFFDRVNHDRLMARLATRVQDKRVFKLIRSFLILSFIFVGSKRAGDRVMESISRFIEKKLLLKINRDKSAVGRSWEQKYLAFCVTNSHKNPKIRLHWKTIKRFKERVREITGRRRGRSTRQIIGELNRFMAWWWNYFRIAESYNRLRPLPHWIRRRLRSVTWKHLHQSDNLNPNDRAQ